MTNVFRLTDRLWSGSEPEAAVAFEALAVAGIRTVVSVDGTPPRVEDARRHGLRYVHIPVGYDGIGPGATDRLLRVLEELPGPVYVHCHHGCHRGPTAAALMAMGSAGWSPERARAWQQLAGVSPDYRGLYRATARPPERAVARRDPAPLPETAVVPDLVVRMVEIDRRWEEIQAHARRGWPDARAAAADSLLLLEEYRELGRLATAADPESGRYRPLLSTALENATVLHASLSGAPPDPVAATGVLGRMQADCRTCHRECRD